MGKNKPQKMDDNREMSALRSAPLSGKGVPERVLLAPWGQVESTNGSFVVDDESAQSAVASFDEHGTDVPIDYEHQTLGGTYSSPSGQAPAAGWIKAVLAEPGVGLIAKIEWTEQARDMLASKEYRYLSPVAIIRRTDRKLVAIHSAALTNKPAIVGMQPIINAQRVPVDETVEESLCALRGELALPEDAPTDQVLLAAGERLSSIKREAMERHVGERVHEAVRAGKLTEAQREWAEMLVAKDEALFDRWLAVAPIVVQTGETTPPSGWDAEEKRRHATVVRARAEYRSNPALVGITTEEAFVNDAVRSSAAAYGIHATEMVATRSS